MKTCCVLLTILLNTCGGGVQLRDAIPAPDAIAGWSAAEVPHVFETENLYDLVNGQAHAFFAYGFEQVAVQTYENGGGNSLRVEVWQLATPADAYGLFSTFRAGTPVSVGNQGDSDPGRRLDFWQDRYFVRVFARTATDDRILEGLAGTVSDGLPTGGERPSLLDRLPGEGLQEGSDIYFHEEISIQDHLWLGGQNLLGLGPATDAVMAAYEVTGERVRLLLVEYPDAMAVTSAQQALLSGGIDDLMMTRTEDNLLAAVFGSGSGSVAEELLVKAFETQ